MRWRVDAAPLLCAGITTFNALRHSGARAGNLVAIHGIGGLGHLGVQYAPKMGFRTVAIARGQDKAPLARQLGAHEYIDSTAGDPGAALKALGGARGILATVTSGEAMGSVVSGLGRNGKLLIVGVSPRRRRGHRGGSPARVAGPGDRHPAQRCASPAALPNPRGHAGRA